MTGQALGVFVAMASEARGIWGRGAWVPCPVGRYRLVTLPGQRKALCLCAGIGKERALRATHWLARQGVPALLGMGLCAGLHPALSPGDLILPESVHEVGHEEVRRGPSEPWSQALAMGLREAGLPFCRGALLSGGHPLLGGEEKQALHSRTLALALDMESGGLSEAAQEAGLPFLVLRAVCDPSSRSVPPALAACLGANGQVPVLGVLQTLLRAPRLLGQAPRLAADRRAALASLRAAWGVLGEIPPPEPPAGRPRKRACP